MNKASFVIILSAGGIDRGLLPLPGISSNSMVPVNGKPAIGWILDDLIAKRLLRVAVVMRSSDRPLELFLKRHYSNRLQLHLVRISKSRSILESLDHGLKISPPGPVSVILGDTLIRDRFDQEKNYVYTGRADGTRRWCAVTARSDGSIISYLDKSGDSIGDEPVLAGYYRFDDSCFLRECVKRARRARSRQISSAMAFYGSKRPIIATPARKWFDFGHIDRLVEARRKLLRPRFFNQLRFDTLLNTITKSSIHQDKLRDELRWYRTIPSRLTALTPRIISERSIAGRLQVEMEYYSYPTLAELYLYSTLPPDAWRTILRRVMDVHNALNQYRGRLSQLHLRQIYWDKTWSRIAALRAQHRSWREILDSPSLQYNGETLHNLGPLRSAIRDRVERLVKTAKIRIVHGDYCFSNILFDISSQIIRIIDPRGSFGKKGVYGDSRYDIAKLRHSATGLYEHITADLFELKYTGVEFAGGVDSDSRIEDISNILDRMILDAGYDLADIRMIEGLLFISMTPLHGDHPQRQRIMYLTGLKRLNEVIKCA